MQRSQTSRSSFPVQAGSSLEMGSYAREMLKSMHPALDFEVFAMWAALGRTSTFSRRSPSRWRLICMEGGTALPPRHRLNLFSGGGQALPQQCHPHPQATHLYWLPHKIAGCGESDLPTCCGLWLRRGLVTGLGQWYFSRMGWRGAVHVPGGAWSGCGIGCAMSAV